jgi:hypothetical protein
MPPNSSYQPICSIWVVDLRLHPTASAASNFNQRVEEVGLINSLAALCQTAEASMIDAARRPFTTKIDDMVCWYAKLLAHVAVEAFSVRVGEDVYPCGLACAIVIYLYSYGLELLKRHSDSGFGVCLGHARSGGSLSLTPCELSSEESMIVTSALLLSGLCTSCYWFSGALAA